MALSEHDFQFALRNLDALEPGDKQHILKLLQEREHASKVHEARKSFLAFVKLMWPSFIAGAHHTIMAEALEKVVEGYIKRLIVNMPPRFTKSELCSWLLPAWIIGLEPESKIIQSSNTEGLASGFGRRVRNLISGEGGDTDQTGHPFGEVFPEVWLAKDSQAAAGWHTNRGGEYFAIGVNGKVTGKGANCAYFACKCLTKRGYISIADVRVGDEVLGYDHERERTAWTRVRAISTQRKPELVNVNGFICTPEHRVYTRRGYRWALEAGTDSDDVLALRGAFYQGVDGLPASDPANREGAYEAILFGRVPPEPGNFYLPSMRRVEGADGDHLQGLLPEGQACPPDLQALWEGHQATEVGAGQKHQVVREHRERLLRPRVLPVVLRGAFSWAGNGYRKLRSLWRPGDAEGREILLKQVLSRAVEAARRTGYAVQRWMESGTPAYQTTVRRCVRDVREGEGSYASASYRSRRDEPHGVQFGAVVRAMPSHLPQGTYRRCARDFEGALQGTGHWVVDLQTDSENFFCEGVLVHNCAIIDDAHSEQEAKQAETNPEVFDTVWNWYSSGIRQRLQPGGKIVIPMTRWSKRDLTGRLIKQMEDADGVHDKWEVISFPAILDEGEPTERSMWPGYWPLEELQRTRAALPVAKWQAQYMQDPTSETAAILKREYWRKWGSEEEQCPGPMHLKAWANAEPPACDYILQSWDCAATKNDRSNYNACTTWGVFKAEDKDSGKTINNIILLNAWKARMEFPELKKKAKQFYDEDMPDTLLIENKSAGTQLIQEFRSMGIAVEDFGGSSRGARGLPNDKIARANMVADVFASGYVWVPDGMRFAELLMEECADFPNGEFDDQVDSTVQALIRFRSGGFIRTANDEEEDESSRAFRRKRYY